jgi:hypothetical protein
MIYGKMSEEKVVMIIMSISVVQSLEREKRICRLVIQDLKEKCRRI